MRICKSCQNPLNFEPQEWRCQKCNWTAVTRDQVVFFEPDVSGATESYDPAWYRELADLEADNFWFRARNHLLSLLARRYFPSSGKYLEIGCGTGFVLQMLQRQLTTWQISATEFQPEGIQFAQERVSSDVAFYQMNACSIPFENEFDAIGAFDVIEHIRDDNSALENVYRALKDGGIFILSVPQHMALWSKYDEIGCHFRRYSNKELVKKLRSAGFTIKESISFNFVLLPLMMLSRFFSNKKEVEDFDVLEEFRLPKILNSMFFQMLRLEAVLIRLGVRSPVGGSRVVVAQKSWGKVTNDA